MVHRHPSAHQSLCMTGHLSPPTLRTGTGIGYSPGRPSWRLYSPALSQLYPPGHPAGDAVPSPSALRTLETQSSISKAASHQPWIPGHPLTLETTFPSELVSAGFPPFEASPSRADTCDTTFRPPTKFRRGTQGNALQASSHKTVCRARGGGRAGKRRGIFSCFLLELLLTRFAFAAQLSTN